MPPRLATIRARNWIFTINNPSDNDLPKLFTDTRFCIWQREKGAQGTEHLQGYVGFTKALTLGQVKTMNSTAHWEPRKGTEQQAIDYCSKAETRLDGPWEFGERSNQGKRSDLLALKETIETGAPMRQIASEHFSAYLKYKNSIVSYKRLFSVPRNYKTFVGVITGPTGCGKSRLMEQTFPDAYWKPNGNEWFCDYDDHRVVIIDEFYGWLRYDFLLRLLDRYSLQCPTKGSSINFRAEYVFITSNSEVDSWYNFRGKMSLDALKRRIDFQALMDEHGTLTVLKGAFDFTRTYTGHLPSRYSGDPETLPAATTPEEPVRTPLERTRTIRLDDSSSSDEFPDIGDSQNTQELEETAATLLERSEPFNHRDYDNFALSRTNFEDPDSSESSEPHPDASPVINYYMDFTSSSELSEEAPTEQMIRTDDIINYRPKLRALSPPKKRKKLFD